MGIKIKKAKISDSLEIFNWRNDLTTRKMSFKNQKVSLKDHNIWMENALKSNLCYLYIGYNDKNKLGICRFKVDKIMNISEVSINLNPFFRGMGYSKKFLDLSIKTFIKNTRYPIIAKIKKINIESINLFSSCGFKKKIEKPDYFEYIYTND